MNLIRKLGYYGYSVFEIILNIQNWIQLSPLFFRRSPSGEHLLKLRYPPLRMIVRSGMDIWSVKETFLDAFYERYGTEVQDGWVVIDIGAGIGDFSIQAAFGRPHTVVYAFEPYPESYQLLVKNLTLNAVDNVIAFQKAIWRQNGRLALDLSEDEPLKIISKDVEDLGENIEIVTVEALTLAKVMASQGIKHLDLLKLDCEGAEYEILMETPLKTLAKMQRIIMEYHDVDEAHNHRQLIAFLEGAGFRVSVHKNIVHEDIGYLFAELI